MTSNLEGAICHKFEKSKQITDVVTLVDPCIPIEAAVGVNLAWDSNS